MSTTEIGIKLKPSALLVLFNGVEEIEAICTLDILRRGGVDVKTISVDSQPVIVGAHEISIAVDLINIPDNMPEFLIIPGGPGVFKLRNNESIRALIQKQNEQQLGIAAICAAPILLDDLSLLDGRNFTAHNSLESDLPRGLFFEQVVVDGNITTACGPGAAMQFAFSILEQLTSKETRDIVAKQMMLM